MSGAAGATSNFAAPATHFTGTSSVTVFGGRHNRFVHAWNPTSTRSDALVPGASGARRSGSTNVKVPS
jgi:hypothetical protein